MNTRKVNLLKLSESEKETIIRKARTYLSKQVSEERMCRSFAQSQLA